FTHQDLPYQHLIEHLKPPRDPSRNPLIQTWFNLRESSGTWRLADDLEVEQVRPHWGTTRFDLELHLTDSGSGPIAGELVYATDLFDEPTMRRFADHYTHLLTTLTQHPDQPISRLPLVTAEEPAPDAAAGREPVETLARGTGGTLADAFAQQAAAHPDEVACVCGDESVTYAELDLRANRLAQLLQRRQVGPESRVALLLDRGIDLVVSVLAVLKAGGAYIPLDPAYPVDRLEFVLADARAEVLVTEQARAGRLTGFAGHTVCLDDPVIRAESMSGPAESPRSGAGRDNLAYVIYTSGSTGQPKGVMVTHGNVLRLFERTRQWFAFGPHAVWTLFHSYAFDFSVWELWGALAHGGRLVVVPFEISRSPEDFLELLVREEVTCLSQTPSAFYQLTQADREHPELGDQLALRHIVFGGEPLELRRLVPWYEHHGDQHEGGPTLVNMYGITETTVHVTYGELDRARIGKAPAWIGEEIPDLRVRVLDQALNPVPTGVVGEIYVAGAGLARGYAGRPDLTAERFLPDPWGSAGSRMYRSGDLARRTEDGSLQFFGRADDQVKIRGFRIEPGEIEGALLDDPDVAQAAVVVQGSTAEEKRLVAYAVPADGRPADFDTEQARERLGRVLPAHMVPAAVVAVDRLPLTPHGKLDRSALPVPDFRSRNRAGRGPRNPVERALCAVFAEVLGIEQVSIDDNFFELGGHSLLALRLIGRAREAAGVEWSVKQLFTTPTVAGLTSGRSESASDGLMLPVVRLRPTGSRPPLWCVHPGSGLGWSYTGLLPYVPREFPVFALQSPGLQAADWQPGSLSHLVSDYTDRILTEQPEGPYRLLGWSFGGTVAHAVAVRLREAGHTVDLLAAIDSWPTRPADPSDKDTMSPADLRAVAFDGAERPAGLDEKAVAAVLRVTETHLRLLAGPEPRAFDGEMLLFEAAPGGTASGAGRLWLPHVTGGLRVVPVDAEHLRMLRPEALTEFGPLLTAALGPDRKS
ncbi:amino acid adenylation domain-containing protein, partial [Streptomyces sp. NPDC050759]|uniref:amino acid adenylation domain-containing protein n=1 Tax=Streptomyces sp. NPDC050759 TaxID=3365635 RepID=UPI0037A4B46A